ncbi:MAG: type II secretion system F family protein [Candidatus Omnitrophica bacterium]|nr:type II secretion system F family protein [Candidatus Omnitrophota bacterium]MBU1933112.1 type II secretion system F family protein [Candidatus Omnitrophota bacterium]
MPTYKYKAQNMEGKIVTGSIVAPRETVVTARLDKQGYLPLSITLEKELIIDFKAFFKPREKVKMRDLVTFTRQFATIVKAGVPILTGLKALSEQSETPVFAKVLKNIGQDIEGGSSLSQAIDKHPNIFSELYVNSVVAGEAGGVLDKVLLRLAEMMERDMETATDVKTAMRYPVLTVFAMIIASFVLVIFVVPNFSSMYARFETQLPLPTRILIAANYFITRLWYIGIPSLIAAGYGFYRFINTKIGRWQFDSLKLKLPVFGKLFTKVAMLRFATMLNVLNESGLPILRTLEIVSITIGNVVIGKEVENMRQSVADGRGISGSMMKSKIFPPLMGHMVAIGEKTGALLDMLNAISEYYDLEIKSTVKNLTTLIEPMMTAILGMVVLGMALAIFLPLWNMIKLFRGAA